MVVDVERGRTIKGWKPRRLGGGKGGRRSHFDPLLAASSTPSGGDSERGVDRDRERPVDDGRRRDREREKERERDRSKSKSRSRSRERERERRKRSKSRGMR